MALSKLMLAGTAALVGAAWTNTTWSQTQLEEVVVTAQRTEENLQRAAVAVTAVTGAMVEARGITELSAFATAVPALQVFRNSGPYNNLRLRGISAIIGPFGDPAITVNVDQVYQSRGFGGSGQFFDIDRVEVVKGPQGIFYGRNATGGAINIVTRAPEIGEFGANIGVDVGNYDQRTVNGMVNLPLGDKWAARIGFQSEQRDGFFSNGAADADTQGVRAQLRWEPADDFNLTWRADYTRDKNHGGGATAYCAGPPQTALTAYADCPATGRFFGDPWTSVVDQQPAISPLYPIGPGGTPGLVREFGDNEYYSASAELNWDARGGTLTMIPAYHHDRVDYMFANGFNFRDSARHDQYSLESRFASDQRQPLRYVLGAFYFTDDHEGGGMFDSRFVVAPGFDVGHIAIEDSATKSSSWAGFGNLTWALTDDFRLSAGVRYTWERKESDSLGGSDASFGPNSPYTGTNVSWASSPRDVTPAESMSAHGFVAVGSNEWTNTSYRVGAEWDWRQGSLLYVAVATGFKSGGFMFNSPGDVLGFTFDPEKVTAYTIGSKNQFFDDRLRLNLELFQYDYKDQQIQSLLQNGAGEFIYATVNAGSSTIKGAELEAEFLPWANTSLSADIQYLDAVYDEFLIPNGLLFSPAKDPSSRCGVVATPGGGSNFAYDCSGQQLVNSPDWTVNLGVGQTFPLANGGSVVAQVDSRYESERELNYSYYLMSQADSNTRTNAALTYNAPDERWSLSAYVRNIEDKATVDLAEPSGNGSGILTAFLRPPRQYGLRFKVNF